MIKVDQIKAPAVVFIVRYNNKVLKRILSSPIIGKVHYFISELRIPRERYPFYRVELELRNRDNPLNCLRKANIIELIYFARRNPEFILEHGPIQGADDNLVKMGKDLGTSFVVPYVNVNPDTKKIEVLLGTEEHPIEGSYKLIATLWRNMS